MKEILESDNDVIIRALKANIEAFLQAVKASKERRRYPRFLPNVPVDFQLLDEQEVISGKVINASQRGLLIQTSHDMPIGKEINLNLSFLRNTGAESFRAKAEIIWKDKQRPDGTDEFQYGVKLIEVFNEGLAELESLFQP